MDAEVFLSKKAKKDLKKIPKRIANLFLLWVDTIETDGYKEMQKIKGYRDHSLIGKRKGQRASCLTQSWRVIYELDDSGEVSIIEVLEVNHHDY